MALPTPRTLLRRTAIALLGILAVALALHLLLAGRVVRLGYLSRGDLVPWYSQWDPRLSLWTLLGVLGCILVVAIGPRLVHLRSGRAFAGGLVVLSLVGWATIALSDGAKIGERRTGLVDANGLTYPFERTAHEYIGDVPKADSLGVRGLLTEWTTPDIQNRLAWHSRTHPPGPVILLLGVDRTLGPGALPAALAVLLLGALAPLVVWRWARLHLGESEARAAALLFAFAPATVLFFATSMEAVFTLLQLLALLMMTLGLRARTPGARAGLSLVGGGALALSTFFTWASILVVFVVGAIEGVRLVRGPDRVAVGGADPVPSTVGGVVGTLGIQVVGFAIVVAGFVAAGWDPVASIRTSLAADAMMMPEAGGVLEWFATGTANLAAWAIGAGLATLAVAGGAIADRTRAEDRLPNLVPAMGLALALAAFSTLFTLEVERIWIVLTAPVLVAALRTASPRGDGEDVTSTGLRAATLRLWLALLVGQALLTELLAETRW